MLILIEIIPLILFVGIPFTIAAILAIKEIKKAIANRKMEVTTTIVRVSSIRDNRHFGSSPLTISLDYKVTFLFPNNKYYDSRYHDMIIPKKDHEWIIAGIDVLLTHQGTRFIKVEPMNQ